MIIYFFVVKAQSSVIKSRCIGPFEMSSVKVIVMGVGGVGKSAITNRFVAGRWIEKVLPYQILNFKIYKSLYDLCLIKSFDDS